MYPNKEQKATLLSDLVACLPQLASDADWATSYRRLHVLPHHGEKAEEFVRCRPRHHPCMTYTDQRPMDIITKGPHDAGHMHSYTVAHPILLKPDAPVFEGVKRPRRNANHAQQQPPDAPAAHVKAVAPTPTEDIPQHLDDDWTPLGRMVSSEQGQPDDVLHNISRHWFSLPTQGCSTQHLIRWPIAPSCSDFIHIRNWFGASRVSPNQQEAYNRVLNAVVITSWLQCWAVLMGRFLHCESARARQTWPMVFRLYEFKCTLLADSKEWLFVGRDPARYSEKVVRHFTVFTRLTEHSSAQAARDHATPEEVKQHMHEWTTFLTQYSMADCMFAWCIMNLNTQDTLEACASMVYKRHQWCLTRHLTPHWLVRRDEQPTHKQYRVIQNTVFPLVQFPSSRAPQAVMALSHPVIRPGLPVFSCQIAPLAEMRTTPLTQLRDQYGHAVFISALHTVWSLAACMTVEEREKQLFKTVFKAGNGGLFDTLLEHCSTAIPAAPQPAAALSVPTINGAAMASIFQPQESSGGGGNGEDPNKNARAQMRIAGLSTPYTGPRNEGRVVHIETEPAQKQQQQQQQQQHQEPLGEELPAAAATENKGPGFQWMNHVGDGRPLSINARRPFLAGIGRALDCLVDTPAEFVWERNHQAFQAPDGSVDLAQFTLYATQSLADPFVVTRLMQLWHTSGLARWLKSPLRLGQAYFQVLLRHHAKPMPEYDVWLLLLWWFKEHLPEKPQDLTQVVVARFWHTFSRSYYQYLTKLCASCVRWLHAGLTHIHDHKARQAAFSHWLRIEAYVTQHRLAAWDTPECAEAQHLKELLKTLCRDHLHAWSQITFRESQGALAWPKLQWLLFFFLVHVVQPAPLPPSYFSESTSPEALQRIRSLYSVVHSTRPQKLEHVLEDLHKAVCYTLTMGNKMFSPDVQNHWGRYAALTGALDGASRTVTAVDRFISTLLTTTNEAKGVMQLLQQYTQAHTAAVFVRVEVPKPLRLDEEDDMSMDITASEDDDNDALLKSLLEVMEPTVMVYVIAQSEEELCACERIYERLFRNDVINVLQVNDPVMPRPVRPPVSENKAYAWKAGYADWTLTPRVFRPFPAKITMS
jgi:hypothetical protein